MADVAIDPQNSDSKELFAQGVRAYVLQDFETAVRAFSKASELLAAEHDTEIHDSLGDVYLYYGKSLLELSRKESGPLGEGVLKNVEEESEEDIEESEGEDGVKAEGDNQKEENKGDAKANKTDDQKTEEAKEDEKKTEGTKTDDKITEETNTEEEKQEGEVSEDTNKDDKAQPSEDKQGDEAEEDLTDLQVAWEVLELAKRIFTARGTDGTKNLAETLIVLGEISLESGNFPAAIEDMVQGLELQKKLFSNDSRTVAETYYKLGSAYSTNAQIDEAIESFTASLEYVQNKVNTLKKDEEHKETNAEEIEELNDLIPEIQEKIADMKNLKTEIAEKVAASADEGAPKTNGTATASSSKQINDISHLVKRKRKEEDVQEENPPKRPSP